MQQRGCCNYHIYVYRETCSAAYLHQAAEIHGKKLGFPAESYGNPAEVSQQPAKAAGRADEASAAGLQALFGLPADAVVVPYPVRSY